MNSTMLGAGLVVGGVLLGLGVLRYGRSPPDRYAEALNVALLSAAAVSILVGVVSIAMSAD